MNEERFENPVELRTAVPPPHFDDRRVAQRAQPVVPLGEIRRTNKLRRLLFLGGAFLLAIVLGAASALLAVQFKRIAATSQISQIEAPDSPATATTDPEVDTTAAAQLELPADTPPIEHATAAVEEPEGEAAEEEPAKPTITAPKHPAPMAQRPRVVNRDRDTLSDRADRDSGQPSEEEQLQQIREAVLYERWQERRQRRIERRERRNRGDRDLSNLEEIFEGRRRPERP